MCSTFTFGQELTGHDVTRKGAVKPVTVTMGDLNHCVFTVD